MTYNDRVETFIQERINSFLIILPDWIYNNFTSHGITFQKHLKVVHDFTLNVLISLASLRLYVLFIFRNSQTIRERKTWLESQENEEGLSKSIC